MHHLPHVPTRKIACDTEKSIHDTEKLFINMLETEFKTAKVFLLFKLFHSYSKIPSYCQKLNTKTRAFHF